MKTRTISYYFGVFLFWAPVLEVAGEQVVTPLWHASYEDGWPGSDWLNWTPIKPWPGLCNEGKAYWDMVTAEGGVNPIEGSKMYKGVITAAHATDSHRCYPILHTDEYGDPAQSFSSGNYMVNRFYIWLDVDLAAGEWVNFATWADDDWGNLFTLSIAGVNEDLEMAHVSWKKLDPIGDNFPMREWVRFTVYIDFSGTGFCKIWMNGTAAIDCSGSPIGDGTKELQRAHWTLYADNAVDSATAYMDSMQIWSLSEPLADLSKEPSSPYDGAGFPDVIGPTMIPIYDILLFQ